VDYRTVIKILDGGSVSGAVGVRARKAATAAPT